MSHMLFKNRTEFRDWLTKNALSDEGLWLIFSKTERIETIKAGAALEEALCFGWIDSQLQSVDDNTYVKYFKRRSKTSTWSAKNRSLAQKLESQGLMTDYGRAVIDSAQKSGIWNTPKSNPLTEEQVREFEDLLKPHEAAWANFEKMTPSARHAYIASYTSTKTDNGKQKRIRTILERLSLNLNPMESMKNKK